MDARRDRTEDQGVPGSADLRTRGPHPWRLADEGSAGPDLVFERVLWGAEGPPLGVSRVVVGLEGAGLSPFLRLALAGYVLLDRLSPEDVGALGEELRAAGSAGSSLEKLLESLGPGARAALDDPMDGVLTGPLQRALAGPGATLLAALAHLEERPDPRDVLVYFDAFVRSRRALLSLALHLARELPPFPAEVLDGAVELFGWWRAHGKPVPVRVGEGPPAVVPLPPGLAPASEEAAAGALGRLLASLHRDAERLGHPRRSFRGVPEEVAGELLDGLAGLLVNGLCLARAPRPDDIASTLVPRGSLPTQARRVRSTTIRGAPFHDALGRFFAVPSLPLALRRTGRVVEVRRTGTCPFPRAGRADADVGFARRLTSPRTRTPPRSRPRP